MSLLRGAKQRFNTVVSFFGMMTLIACQSEQDIRREQYISEGQQLYTQHCSGCHQPGGEGFERLYPPLNRAGLWAESKRATHLCAMRYGLKKPLAVEGITYHQSMPGNTALTDPDLAMLLTFLENKFGKTPTTVSAKAVSGLMKGCQE